MFFSKERELVGGNNGGFRSGEIIGGKIVIIDIEIEFVFSL